jgi:Amt family ammonium transporter
MNHRLTLLYSLFLIVLPFEPLLANASGDSGTTAWMLTSTVLVLLMVPGLAMFYGGLVRTKNVLGTMLHSYGAMAVVGVLWIVCGYAIAFGDDVFGGFLGWDSGLLFLSSIDEKMMDSGIPEYVFAMFQGKFAIITPAILAGAFAERVRFRSYCLFIALWMVFIYSPLCHWVWHEEGFLYKMGAIDFAGGTVVHISAGASGLVAALFLGSRKGYQGGELRPNNLVMTLIGVGLLWVGWFGFNAGSSVSSNLQTAQALTATQAAAAAGAMTWMAIEAMHLGKSSSLGVASGILAGLVAITPAAGVTRPFGALVLGALGAGACYLAINLKSKLGYDDSLDAFGIHGIGGITGALFLTFFMRPGSSELPTIAEQFGVQLLGVVITLIYCSIVTLGLLWLVSKITPIRLEEAEEMAGMDHALHGENGYGNLNLD